MSMPGCARVVGVRRSEKEHDLLAGVDRAAAHLDVLCRHAGDRRHRALPAQQLLDRRRDDLRVLDQLAAMLGLLGQVGEHAVERVGHRVEAGDHEQEADVQDLVVGELLPVELGGHDPPEEIGLIAGSSRRSSTTIWKYS